MSHFTNSRVTRRTLTGLAIGILVAALMPAAAHAATQGATGSSPETATTAPTGTTATTSPTTPPALPAAGAVPRVPAKSVDEGLVAASTPLRLDVVLSPRDPQGMATLAQEIATPGSPEFRHFLARGQVAAMFGPTPATIAAVTAALASRGLHPGAVYADGLDIPVTTTAAAAESAFNVNLHLFHLTNGRNAYANTSAPSLPANISNAIVGVVGLDDLNPPQPDLESALPATTAAASLGQAASANLNDNLTENLNTNLSAAVPTPCAAASGTSSATADQLAAAYGFTGLYSQGDQGAGATIGLFELSGYSSSDITAYESCYGITGASVTPVGSVSIGGGVDEVEGDIEIALGLAPKAKILVYEDNSYLGAWNDIISADIAPVVSTSWSGGCEPSTTVSSAENTDLMTAAMQGQTVFAASGDGGSEDCLQGNSMGYTGLAVQDPASQPFITGVGGTNLSNFNSPAGETGWVDSTGGISTLWPMPGFQSGSGVTGVINSYSSKTPCGASSGYCREVPDVSALSGGPGFAYYCTAGTGPNTCPPPSNGWLRFFGTSGAAPLWAAFAALTVARCPSTTPGKLGLGDIDPLLYNLASQPKGAGTGYFNDITSGDNDMTGNQGGAYPATTGYDMVTGLGSPLGVNLAGGLCQDPIVPVTVTGTSVFGGPITFTSRTGSLPSGVTGTTGTLTGCTSTVTATDPPATYNGTITGCQGLSLTGPNAGNYTISYVDGGVTVSKAATTTTVSSGTNPSVFGQAVTFTATVAAKAPGAGTPSGTVDFLDGTSTLGSGTLNQSSPDTATFTTTSPLAVGPHSITAKYEGDSDFKTSTSPAITQTVNKDATTTAVTSNANPSVFGQPVTLTATVSANAPGAGTPTGTVQFFDGATMIGASGSLTSGAYSITIASLSVATHTITADYGGDGNFLASNSAVFDQVVNKAPTNTTLTANPPGSVAFGNAVTFTATVSVPPPGAGSPTGPVIFSVDGTPVQTVTLNASEQASVTTSALSPGTHVIGAAYQGDGNFLPSSGTLNYTVTCLVTITGSHPSAVIASGPTTCVVNATVGGAIVVPKGDSLAVINSVVDGSINAPNSPNAVEVCGSNFVGGAVTISGAQGLVIVGDPGDAGCAPNTIGGNLLLTNNTHGLEAIDNTVGGLIVSGNSGPGPYPGDVTTISGNVIKH